MVPTTRQLSENFTVASDDVAMRQFGVVAAVHPLVVADKVYWVYQVHTSKYWLKTIKSARSAMGVKPISSAKIHSGSSA